MRLAFALPVVAVALSACSSTPYCSTSTCMGCCDASDTCLAGTETQACGKGGFSCVACPSGQSCQSGTCAVPPACTPANCTGCCDAMGACSAGTTLAACGTGGNACLACGSGKRCMNGTCVTACSPANCAGCCDATGTCQLGTTSAACGTAGLTCSVCTAQQTCNAQRQCFEPCPSGLATVTTAQLQPLVAARCATCHYPGVGGAPNGSGFPYGDLTSAAKTQQMVGQISQFAVTLSPLKVVTPNNLSSSSLWLKVAATGVLGNKGPRNEPTGAKMPNDGSMLSAAEVNRFRDWICTGATP